MKRGRLDYVIGMDFGQFFFATLLVPPGFWEISSAFTSRWLENLQIVQHCRVKTKKDLYNATLF